MDEVHVSPVERDRGNFKLFFIKRQEQWYCLSVYDTEPSGYAHITLYRYAGDKYVFAHHWNHDLVPIELQEISVGNEYKMQDIEVSLDEGELCRNDPVRCMEVTML